MGCGGGGSTGGTGSIVIGREIKNLEELTIKDDLVVNLSGNEVKVEHIGAPIVVFCYGTDADFYIELNKLERKRKTHQIPEEANYYIKGNNPYKHGIVPVQFYRTK